MPNQSDYPLVPCPKCNRNLKASGELAAGGTWMPVYHCDECLVTKKLFGQSMEMALVFSINKAGQPVDPTAPDNVLRF